MSDMPCKVEGCTERHNHPSGYCYIHIETAERITAAPSGQPTSRVIVDGFSAGANISESSTFRSFRGW